MFISITTCPIQYWLFWDTVRVDCVVVTEAEQVSPSVQRLSSTRRECLHQKDFSAAVPGHSDGWRVIPKYRYFWCYPCIENVDANHKVSSIISIYNKVMKLDYNFTRTSCRKSVFKNVKRLAWRLMCDFQQCITDNDGIDNEEAVIIEDVTWNWRGSHSYQNEDFLSTNSKSSYYCKFNP